MPPALLRSQFDALEEPGADEHAITVPIDATPEEIADAGDERASLAGDDAQRRPRVHR